MEHPGEDMPLPRDRTAVAIHYDPDKQSAPTVIATGKGEVAATIIRIAQENNVPLQSDPVLATALAGLDLGNQIPPELYRAVAEVLAFVFKLSNKPIPTRTPAPIPTRTYPALKGATPPGAVPQIDRERPA